MDDIERFIVKSLLYRCKFFKDNLCTYSVWYRLYHKYVCCVGCDKLLEPCKATRCWALNHLNDLQKGVIRR